MTSREHDGTAQGQCCDAMYAVDGLVVPSEPTDPDSPGDHAQQEWFGDALLALPRLAEMSCPTS